MKTLHLLVFTAGIAGVFLIDVANMNIHGMLTNGFFDVSAMRVFHIGQYVALGSLVYLAINLLRREK